MSENYNLQPDTSSQTVRNADSYNLDTREQLEADIANCCYPSSIVMQTNYDEVCSWLNRQAVITEREASEWHNKFCAWCEQVTDGRIAELTAEVEKQRQRANDAERGVLSDKWYVARDRYKDDVAELTAEREQYRDNMLAQTRIVAELTAERDNLQAAIDAMENGQFYAMYRRACQERDALKHDREKVWCDCDCCGWQAEREQMQRVIDTQRESFKKMEFELAQAKGGSDDEG